MSLYASGKVSRAEDVAAALAAAEAASVFPSAAAGEAFCTLCRSLHRTWRVAPTGYYFEPTSLR
jgi:hypothetical protein